MTPWGIEPALVAHCLDQQRHRVPPVVDSIQYIFQCEILPKSGPGPWLRQFVVTFSPWKAGFDFRPITSDLWQTKWHWDRFFSGYDHFPANIVSPLLQSFIWIFIYHRRLVIVSVNNIFKPHTQGSFTDILKGKLRNYGYTHTHTHTHTYTHTYMCDLPSYFVTSATRGSR